ncbi:hypothetical protein PSN_5594 [Pseudomonas sp. NGC7]
MHGLKKLPLAPDEEHLSGKPHMTKGFLLTQSSLRKEVGCFELTPNST